VTHDVQAHWLAAMRAGDWEAAWRQTDRIELPRRAAQRRPGFARQPHQLWWDGRPFAGERVLVRCEHGLGDTLLFSRFLPALARQARELHVMVQPPLVDLLRGGPGLGQVHNGWLGPHWPSHDVEIEVMELAYALRATPSTLPPPWPHLAAQVAGESVRVEGDGRPRVGLLWSTSDWDLSRSVPAAALAPLLALEHLQFFALQQGPAALDPALAGAPLVPLWRRTADVRACAAAMLQLDLVVCVDGMPAHLAGMLGRPTWLLLKHDADWRWMDGRGNTPWYPSMHLFRQPRPDDWQGLVEAVAEACRRLTATPTNRCGDRLPQCAQSPPIIG
jgi:hypothetical protein